MSESDADFEIELGQSVQKAAAYKPRPLKDRKFAAAAYDRPESDAVPIFIAEDVLRAIEAHAESDPENEIGGVLLGRFYQDDLGPYVEVSDLIEAAGARSTGVSLTFTHDTWERIAAEQAQKGHDAAIVGWYHSHPGLGVFLSKEDEFIHANYFGEEWHVALVVDPVQRDWGCFRSGEHGVKRSSGFYVFGARREAKQLKDYITRLQNGRSPVFTAAGAYQPAARGTTKLLWTAVILLGIGQFVTGWLALSASRPTAAKADYYRSAISLLSACDLGGGEQMLRLQLVSNPRDTRALRELQRLQAILDQPGTKSNEFDAVNFLLQRADKLAESKPDVVKRPELEGLISEEEGKVRLEAADPTREAYRVYEWARSSRGERLRRGKLVADAGNRVLGGRVRKGWWDAALKWLEEEPLREIAYGLHSGQSHAEKVYAKLNPEQKAMVKRIRSQIAKAK